MKANLKFSFSGHNDAIYVLTKIENDNKIVSAGADGKLISWQLDEPGKAILLAQVSSPIYSILVIKDFLLFGTRLGQIHVLDLSSKKEIKLIQISKQPIFAINYHPQTNSIIIGCGMGVLSQISTENFKIISQKKVSEKAIRAISIHPQNNKIGLGASDNAIYLADLDSETIQKLPKGHNLSVFSLAFTPSGRFLLSGGRDALLKAWDLENNTEIASINAHWYAINKIAISPCEQYLATASRDKTAKIWQLSDLSLVDVITNTESGIGHTHSVNTLLYTANGQLITAGDDRTINLWQPKN